jgi:hypothetical protein
MRYYVTFILCKNGEILRLWNSSDRFAERVKAMEMAQTLVRNIQDSGYSIYYKIKEI